MLFDLWPVYAPPVFDGVGRAPLCALRYQQRWVSWDTERADATLVDELSRSCMVRIIGGRFERGEPVKIVLERKGELKIVAVRTGMMKKHQLDTPGEEFSGITFEDYYEGEPGDEV
jgi:hypothetical protein